ncbi:hypothetical protein AB1399_00705 [Hydrogenibacillus schlegelii]
MSLKVEEEIPDPLPTKGPAAWIDACLKSFTTLADETGAIRRPMLRDLCGARSNV